MTVASYLYSASVLTLLTTNVYSLSANAGSPCYDICNGSSATTSSDIVCTDNDFATTSQGQLFQSCLSCLQTSSYGSGFRSDSILFLYYLSLTQQTCLVPSAPSPIASCTPQCTAIETAFGNQNGQQLFQSPAGYCSSSNYGSNADACGTCLQSQEGTVILGNFVIVSAVACTELPQLASGNPITFAGNVFNTTPTSTISSSTASSATKTTIAVSSMSISSPSVSPSGTTAQSITISSIAPTSLITLQSSTSQATVAATGAATSEGKDQAGGRCLSKGILAAIGILAGLVGVALIVALAFFARRRRQESWKEMKEPPNSLHPNMSEAVAASGAVPVAVAYRSKSLRSLKTLKSSLRDFSPATAEWWYATNPKNPADLSALPQKTW